MVTREQTESRTRYTLAAFHAFADQPENAGRLLELIDGEIAEKVGSFTPSQIAALILIELGIYLKSNPIGRVTGADGSYTISEDNEFIPDVAYISKVRLPERPEREAPIPPDLAVEVKSPTDRLRALRRKAERYLEAGTRLVWLVLPDDQSIEVYMPDADVLVLRPGDTLDGGEVLPGFTLAVSAIFEG
jgi:Uma2 family endonuclease